MLKHFLLICMLTFQNRASTTEIALDKEDLNAVVNFKTGQLQLTAYKSTKNDKILNESNASAYNHLTWYSLGAPKLIKTLCLTANKTFLFHMNDNGFHTFIDSLKTVHKRVLAEKASEKYSIDVSPSQIHNFPTTRLDCRIYFNDDTNNRTLLINGNASALSMMMSRLNFRAPTSTIERNAFEKLMRRSGPFQVQCQYWFGDVSQQQKPTHLTISATQMGKLEVAKKLFEKSNTVYLTRAQLQTLASKVYDSLKIMSDYQVSDFEFSAEFITLITTKKNFTLVSLDEALKLLSKYSLSPKLDLKSASVKKQASMTLKIDKIQNNSVIKVSNDSKKLGNSPNLDALLGQKTVRIVDEYSNDWLESNRTLEAQLYDLNYWVRDEVEWKFEDGNAKKLVPKSISVVKLTKSTLPSFLTFSTIKKHNVAKDKSKIIKLEANF